MGRPLQYMRTDKAITEAFIKLCTKHNFEDLTIQMIMDEALVSRNTFYAHYHDKYEIAEKLFDQFISDFNAFLNDFYERDKMLIFSLSPEEKSSEFAKRTTEFNEDHAALYGALARIHTEELSLTKALSKLFAEKYCSNPLNNTHGGRCSLESLIYAGIQTCLCQYHLSSCSFRFENTKDDADAVLYAALYALGIHNPEYVEEAAAQIRKYEELEAANPLVFP